MQWQSNQILPNNEHDIWVCCTQVLYQRLQDFFQEEGRTRGEADENSGIALKNRVRNEVLSEIVSLGEALDVVIESKLDGEYVGHSDSYVEVRCASSVDIRGESVKVIPEFHKNGVVYGNIQKIG